MALLPELGRFIGKPEVKSVPDAVDISQKLSQETGIRKVETAFSANVKDDTKADLTQSPETKAVVITIPSYKEKIEAQSKGGADEASTWWGAYFVRMIKKALHFGWKVVFGKN